MVTRLLDHVHVRGFQIALLNRAQAVGAGCALLGLARGGRLDVEVLAARLQACGIDELAHCDIAHLLRRGLAGHGDADHAVMANGHLGRALRDGDAIGHGQAAGSYQAAWESTSNEPSRV